MNNEQQVIDESLKKDYAYGFVTDIESETLPPGLNDDVIRTISGKKEEPEWLLEWRLKAYHHWLKMEEPKWAKVVYPEIDYQTISYYSAPKKKELASLDEVDPELLATYTKLGIPLEEQKMLSGVAVDAVFDSVSVATTFKEELKKAGVIFGSFSEAVKNYPELIKKYLGSVVPYTDNYYAALNSAVFTDGSFVYIPKGVKCPMELSTYFRINEANTGQFERTLIIADEGSYVSYLEGCTAPQRDENQLHAAVVELVAHKDATIKYSTVQNWYPGNPKTGAGGIYNFVTKRGICLEENSHISWTQVETGSAVTWKYPSCILKGDNSIGEFYHCVFQNNSTNGSGGGITLKNDADIILDHVFFIDNLSDYYGGGLYCNNSSPALNNVTITLNESDYGGGIYCRNGAEPSLLNTIIWDNIGSETPEIKAGIANLLICFKVIFVLKSLFKTNYY